MPTAAAIARAKHETRVAPASPTVAPRAFRQLDLALAVGTLSGFGTMVLVGLGVL